VRPVLVVVLAVDTEVAAAEDEGPVKAVGAERADPPLGVGVRVRCLNRRTDHPDPLGPEHLVEGVAELRVSVVDEEQERLLVAELQDEIARLLGDRAPVRVGGSGHVLDPPGCERDEEQHVDPLEKRGFDGKEVTGEHARGLLA
jgi:hypothetical protein